ncbi:hypothetical protein SUVZ_02G6370 [Saccharomyces uvarum]|uniref:Uncharacterized protein n=1 Tax=Saccharomyces uvarum TaxID=230603 RepID=A0ABN8WT69_SACUV|nr:hypothetical protein SUVZ_02G6370 [Saccharomyces uvarum]
MNTEIEDEESVGLLSSRRLESQNIALPKDVFRNFFSWFCYQIYKIPAFRISLLLWLLLWLPLGVWWKISSRWNYPLLAAVCMDIALLTFPINMMIYRKHVVSKQYTRFCKEIIKSVPGTDIEDWEPIVIKFNSYMYENKLWNNEYFFFDGSHCYESFRTYILEPFSLKEDNNAKAKSFKESVPYIEEALKVYFAEVDKSRNQSCCEKSMSAINLEDVPLPKQLYRFKAVWTFKTAMNRHYSLSVLFFMMDMDGFWNDGVFLNAISLGCSLFILTEGFQVSRVCQMKMDDKIKYLLAITNEQEIGANRWDRIAKKMNVYLFEKKVYSNKEFFFDGIDCKRFFDCNFSSLLSSKTSVPHLSLNAELWPYIKKAQLACGGNSLV